MIGTRNIQNKVSQETPEGTDTGPQTPKVAEKRKHTADKEGLMECTPTARSDTVQEAVHQSQKKLKTLTQSVAKTPNTIQKSSVKKMTLRSASNVSRGSSLQSVQTPSTGMKQKTPKSAKNEKSHSPIKYGKVCTPPQKRLSKLKTPQTERMQKATLKSGVLRRKSYA